MTRNIFFSLFVLFLLPLSAIAQVELSDSASTKIDYANPKEYELGGIKFIHAEHFDQRVLTLLTGLATGDKIQIPGDKISKAIENLWKQGLFEDIKVEVDKRENNVITLNIIVTERPRLAKFSLKGVSKSEADDLREKIKLIKGKVVTEYLISSSISTIKSFFIDKGYMNVTVFVPKPEKDTSLANSVILVFNIKKGERVKVQDIFIHGNTAISTGKLLRSLKETKVKRWWNVFNSGKYLEENYEKDKPNIIEKYNALGYRDAKIVRDTVYKISPELVNIEMWIDEGQKYYFRTITWVGNTKYTSRELASVLGIKKGDIYDQSNLEAKLFMNPSGGDVSSLYMDDGYLFFQVTPVEILVEHDSIDLEMRVYEGKQAIINKVTVTGNTKTNDHVIIRELRTKPGQLFKRSDIIRTQRELSTLGYFNPEKLSVNPTPNPQNGTVDIEYVVEEKPSDQLELSGGYGANHIVGTLGVKFTNFSASKFFHKDAWRPLPSGDGQSLSLRAQSYGIGYQTYTLAFTEPWLGGKKPTSMTISTFYSNITNGVALSDPTLQRLQIIGGTVGFGTRLKKPDDFFNAYAECTYKYYDLDNYQTNVALSNGYVNNFYVKGIISRNSVNQPTFPTSGSNITLSAEATPPYSLFDANVNYTDETPEAKYKFLEYYKFKFTAAWYISLTHLRSDEGKPARNLVLYTKAGFGFLNAYNQEIGIPPFERFFLGGSGLTGFNLLDGREIIALRGYEASAVYSGEGSYLAGAATICKYTAELRYPISLNPSATLYALGFAEAGNTWDNFQQFNPFNVLRSAGAGVRIFLPMFGMLGFDYGWGFDPAALPTSGINPVSGRIQGQFSFTIGAQLGEL
jgi:outer membrane protein insertion porin family